MKTWNMIAMLICGCMLINCGCAPKAQMAPETATGLVELRHALATGKICMERAIEALEDVSQSPRANTQIQIELFAREMAALDAEAARIRGIDNRIQAAAETHFAAWETEIKNVRNPKIAAVGEQRHKKTRETMEGIRSKMHDASIAVRPLMSNLQDINNYLAKDKTAEAVQGMRQSIEDTLKMKTNSINKIDAVIAYIDDVTRSVQ